MDKDKSLYTLIQSLNKAEKKAFSIISDSAEENKIYLFLFQLMKKQQSIQEIKNTFHTVHPKASYTMAVKHLYDSLLDCLSHRYEKQDTQSIIFAHISKAAILYERELYNEALAELSKGENLARLFENDIVLLLIKRTEMKYQRALNFKDINEKEIVGKQTQMNEMIKSIRNANMHISLYDILRYRLYNQGSIRSEKQKSQLNDLVLSELSVISSQSYQGFESIKQHLLFQSTYYLNVGNLKAAIRYYKELIDLFENNRHLLLNPPIHYFSAIEGILDSLHTAGSYSEMFYFIEKLQSLKQPKYSPEFCMKIDSYLYLYNLIIHTRTGDFEQADCLVLKEEENLKKWVQLVTPEMQVRLYLYTALTSLCALDFQKAKKQLKGIFMDGKRYFHTPSFKSARLINLIVQAELGNYEFTDSEIKAIKRNIKLERQTYKTEKLIFKFIGSYPLPVYKKDRMNFWLKAENEIRPLLSDKYEQQLLKTFDFPSWIESRITKKSFKEILFQKNQISSAGKTTPI